MSMKASSAGHTLMLFIKPGVNNLTKWLDDTVRPLAGAMEFGYRVFVDRKTIEEAVYGILGEREVAPEGAVLSKEQEESNKERAKAIIRFKVNEQTKMQEFINTIEPDTLAMLRNNQVRIPTDEAGNSISLIFSEIQTSGSVSSLLDFISAVVAGDGKGQTMALVLAIERLDSCRMRSNERINGFVTRFLTCIEDMVAATGHVMSNPEQVARFFRAVQSEYNAACVETIAEIEKDRQTKETMLSTFASKVEVRHGIMSLSSRIKASQVTTERHRSGSVAHVAKVVKEGKSEGQGMCFAFERNGSCQRGEACRFSHGEGGATTTKKGGDETSKKPYKKGRGRVNEAVKGDKDGEDFGSVSSNEDESAYRAQVATIIAALPQQENYFTLIFDTGANVSIVKDKALLLRGPFDMEAMEVKGYGANMTASATMYGFTVFGRTIYNPNASCNLVSDHQITKKGRFAVRSYQSKYVIKRLRDGKEFIFSKENSLRLPVLQLQTDETGALVNAARVKKRPSRYDNNEGEDEVRAKKTKAEKTRVDKDVESKKKAEKATRAATKAAQEAEKAAESERLAAEQAKASVDFERQLRLKLSFSPAQTRRIELCTQLHAALGFPGDEAMRSGLRNSAYIGTEVTEQDFLNMRMLHGPSREHQFGHLHYKESGGQYVVAEHAGEHLHCDIVFVAGPDGPVPVHIGVDERTTFGVASKMDSKTATALATAQSALVNFFKPLGHHVQKLYYDRETTIRATEAHVHRLGCLLIQAPATEHEKICERYVRTLNGIMRSIGASLPYKLPAALNVHLLLLLLRSSSTGTCPTSKRAGKHRGYWCSMSE